MALRRNPGPPAAANDLASTPEESDDRSGIRPSHNPVAPLPASEPAVRDETKRRATGGSGTHARSGSETPGFRPRPPVVRVLADLRTRWDQGRAQAAKHDFARAEWLVDQGALAEAEGHALRAIELDPEQYAARALLAWIHAQQRGVHPQPRRGEVSAHYDDLIGVLDEILASEPCYERALFYRGMLLKRSGRRDAAISDFRMAAALDDGRRLDAVRELRLETTRSKRGLLWRR